MRSSRRTPRRPSCRGQCSITIGRPIRPERYRGRGAEHIAWRSMIDEVMYEIRELTGQDVRQPVRRGRRPRPNRRWPPGSRASPTCCRSGCPTCASWLPSVKLDRNDWLGLTASLVETIEVGRASGIACRSKTRRRCRLGAASYPGTTMSTITISLPDGAQRELDAPATPLDLAAAIGSGLQEGGRRGDRRRQGGRSHHRAPRR